MSTRFCNVEELNGTGWLLLLGLLGSASTAFGADSVTALAPDESAVKWVECAGWPKGCEAALVAGDYEKGASAWFCRAPKGYMFPRHSHTAAERIIVLRGRLSGGVDGGGEMMVTPGMFWGFGEKAVHWVRCEDACLMYIHYDAPFDVTFR